MLRAFITSSWLAPRRLFPDVPTGRLPRLLAALLMGACAYGLLSPLLAVCHELLVLGAAVAVREAIWLPGAPGLWRLLPLDPIYTSALLLTVAGIVPRGLAIAGPLGDALATV